MTSYVNRTYDNTDQQNLRYQGSWTIEGHWNATAIGETGTLASTYDTTCNVTFTFPEPAIAFYYWGFKNSRGAQWGMCIDCNPNNRVFTSINGEDPLYDGTGPPLLLFSKRFPELGVHQIILRNEPDPNFNGVSRITLDRFDIEIAAGSSVAPTTITTTIPGSQSSVPSPTPTPRKAAPIGPIVGGVVGGVLFLVLLLLMFLFFRRRGQKGSSTAASPFPVPVGNLTQETSTFLPSVNHIPNSNQKRYTTLNPQSAPVSSGSTTPSLRRPIHEIDAGPVTTTDDDDDGGGQSSLPPEYTRVFP